MSENEYHQGKLRKYEGDHEAKATELLIELCDWTLDGVLAQVPHEYDSAIALYGDECWGEDFIVVNGELYELIDHIKEDECYGFMHFNKNQDGTFSFSTLFYNGGTCLEEMLSDEVNKL